VVLYVFCGQSIFIDGLGQYEPGGQTEQYAAPKLENVLPMHGMHVEGSVAPLAALYVPGLHGVFVFVSGQ
jgi:hypothetical protein